MLGSTSAVNIEDEKKTLGLAATAAFTNALTRVHHYGP
jgi:hypothetical protein